MNLFGCKFCEEIKDEKVCDRKNFDSLLWSLVTVFQVRFLISEYKKIPAKHDLSSCRTFFPCLFSLVCDSSNFFYIRNTN